MKFPSTLKSLRRFVLLFEVGTRPGFFCRLFQDDRKRGLRTLLNLIDQAIEVDMPYGDFIANWALGLLKGLSFDEYLEIQTAAINGDDLTPFYQRLFVHGVQKPRVPVFAQEEPTILWVHFGEISDIDLGKVTMVQEIFESLSYSITNIVIDIEDVPENNVESWLQQVILFQGGVSSSLFTTLSAYLRPELVHRVVLQTQLRELVKRITYDAA